jgi:quinol monooxygenase YgiN
MSDNDSSISVHVTLTVDPGKTDEFLGHLRPFFAKMSSEPLNTFTEVYQDARAPGVFKLVENWNTTPDYMINVSG